MGGEAYFGLDPKEVHKSYLQSPFETHNEDENKATPLGCEAEILLEEKATIVSVQEDGNVKNMDNKSYNFCSSPVHLQTSDPCKDTMVAFSSTKFSGSHLSGVALSSSSLCGSRGDCEYDLCASFGSDPKGVSPPIHEPTS